MTIYDVLRALVDGSGAVLNSPDFRTAAYAAISAAEGSGPAPAEPQAQAAAQEGSPG